MGPEFGFGLYIHWPYCAKICPYCDFNVYAAKDRDTAPLLEAIEADLKRHKAELPDHPALNSIFFGGGTPSLLAPDQIERLIECATQTFGLIDTVEITLEANPNDVLRSTPEDWRNAGINRLSLGVQSLDDDALRFLGRDHDARAAKSAFEAADRAFDNLSVDVIYALPDQDLEQWRSQLSDILALGAPHLSLYELTIEPPTPFGKQVERGQWTPLPDDRQADLYELTQSLCEEAGLPAYEVSNHARSPAYQSMHNKIYWNSGDWIGVGPGAHGRLTKEGVRLATEATRRPPAYMEQNTDQETALSKLDVARELVAMALRHEDGLQWQRLADLGFERPDNALIGSLQDAGLLAALEDGVALTASGRLLSDHVSARIAP